MSVKLAREPDLMNLPGRLSRTTLGDLFGAFFRSRVSGTLELTEDTGPVAGRAHRLQFETGLIYGIESALGAPPLGELLVKGGVLSRHQHIELLLHLKDSPSKCTGDWLAEFHWVEPDTFCRAMRQQLSDRLSALFELREARVAYRIARPTVSSLLPSVPLTPEEFLHGKPRNRDRCDTQRASAPADGTVHHDLHPRDAARLRALLFLGLLPHASTSDVKKAFHRMVSRLHPDRHLSAPQSQQDAARFRFAQTVNAYNTLLHLEETSHEARGAT